MYTSIRNVVLSSRGLMYHGTSSAFLRSILKKGLIPDPNMATYEQGDIGGRGSRSITTYGGVYVTDSVELAVHSARVAVSRFKDRTDSRNITNPVMISMILDTRSPNLMVDEDVMLHIMEKYVGATALDMGMRASLWYDIFNNANIPCSVNGIVPQWSLEDCINVVSAIQNSDIPYYVMISILNSITERWPASTRRVRSNLRRVTDMVDTLIREYSLHLMDSFTNGIPGISGSFDRIRDAVNDISHFLKETSYEAPIPTDILTHNLRLSVPVTYRGRNRICMVSEIIPHNGPGTIFKPQASGNTLLVHYGSDAYVHQFVTKYESEVGRMSDVQYK